MKKILVSAFEPFGGEKKNASKEVLDHLPDQIAGYSIRKVLLPVVFGTAGKIVLESEADYYFLLGLAGGRLGVTPEKRAVNLKKARIPDNMGNKPENELIDPDGIPFYFTGIPAEDIVKEMQAAGYNIAVSDDAGTFVCNETFYIVGTGTASPVDFIHVPYCEEHNGDPYMPVNDVAETVRRYIELAVSTGVREE